MEEDRDVKNGPSRSRRSAQPVADMCQITFMRANEGACGSSLLHEFPDLSLSSTSYPKQMGKTCGPKKNENWKMFKISQRSMRQNKT